ncbi:unnamed protein product [Blepharisma stoltei]|uniref:ATP synthase protein MI25 n=1 Tax=Blepharisma stoltei TaxID=1481888 RepID=A0AAU9J4J9_9CILI|nr:unnamed protein product [Blepharisma stoltei]
MRLNNNISKRKHYICTVRDSKNHLVAIKKELKKDLKKCRVFNTLGAVTSILGTALIFTPLTLLGAGAVILGGGTSIGSKIVRRVLEGDALEEVRKVLIKEEKAQISCEISEDEFDHFMLGLESIVFQVGLLATTALKSIDFTNSKVVKKAQMNFAEGTIRLSTIDIIATWVIESATLRKIKEEIKKREKIIDEMVKEIEYLERLWP